MYPDGMLDGMLFETSYSKGNNEESVLGAMREQAQAAFALLLGKCLHAM